MDIQTKESTLHIAVIAALIVMVGVVSFFKWPSDITGATPAPPPCTIPEDGKHYLSDTTLCPGEYHLPLGIFLSKDRVVLDCNHATLIGDNKAGFGIRVTEDSQVVKNCVITNYKYGLLIIGNNDIVDSSNTLDGNMFYYTRDPNSK